MIKENSEITSLLIHGGQWTATLKPIYFSKRLSSSDVTLKVTQSYTFFLNFVFKFQSYLKIKFKKKLLLEKFLKLHLSRKAYKCASFYLCDSISVQ